MNLLVLIAVIAAAQAELFYDQTVFFSDGDQWRIQPQSAVSSSCDSTCGSTCLNYSSITSFLECLEPCGCQGSALPVVFPSVSPDLCSSKCVEVCAGQDKACFYRCETDFCESHTGQSMWIAVGLDAVLFVLVLSMLYVAFVYTPKRQKRGRYWRHKILEAQYSRLENY